MPQTENEQFDISMMKLALSLARAARSFDEVPIGALVIDSKNKIIGTGFNWKESSQQPHAHAELIAIENGCKYKGSWRLSDCTLYSTLEPCIMCSGVIHQSRIKRVVYGAPDPKFGALGSLYELHNDQRLNHTFAVESGVLKDEAAKLMQDFFRKKRK